MATEPPEYPGWEISQQLPVGGALKLRWNDIGAVPVRIDLGPHGRIDVWISRESGLGFRVGDTPPSVIPQDKNNLPADWLGGP